MLGIALLGTGRLYYGILIAVTELGDCLRFAMGAACTGTLSCLRAVLRTSRGFGYRPRAEGVSKCVGVVIGIGIAAF